ncbi:MAG: hypothetical protein LBH39_08435 [Clostridiales Family XIII bacterium]|jgi:hypothetical protein|nr:hypothetical protein [Clostridiales Family XIII bacterium]
MQFDKPAGFGAWWRRRGIKRGVSILLSVAMMVPVFCLSPAWAAADALTVIGGDGMALKDSGRTNVRGATDVYVDIAPGMDYYYAFADSYVDVYYTGEASGPNGSFFDGPFVPGALAAMISSSPDMESGTPVDATGKIEIPSPQPGTPLALNIAAYRGDEAVGLFTHVFALETIRVTDGGAVVYQDFGTTEIGGDVDVYISPEGGMEYYYLIDAGDRATVEVYYVGETGDPNGSVIGGPFVNGAKVFTIGDAPDTETWARALPEDGYRISVPRPEAGSPVKLRIAAYADGVPALEYSHTFVQGIVEGDSRFYAETRGGTVVARVENRSPEALTGTFILAIYTAGGKLAYSEAASFTAAANGNLPYTFAADLADYPAEGGYTAKVFCWDGDFMPLFEPAVPEAAGAAL